MTFTNNIANMSQGPPNPAFRSVRLEKGLTRFQKFFSIWVPMNPSQDWKAKLESAYSLMVQNCKNTVCTEIAAKGKSLEN